ncbi:hypothetical protein ACKF11_08975 [Methylobacillus sp. Pita2]|uniref:hypothetical protein n=1 Tax=Methylobacillus sp. Pita2 TaxID=3383245 RepID=UPI0038B5D561
MIINSPKILLMVINNKRAFSELLIKLCEADGLLERGRQAALVRYLKGKGHKISQPAVKKWFDGESLPETDKALDLARMFHISVDDLLSGNKEALHKRKQSQAGRSNEPHNEIKSEWPFGDRITPEQYSTLYKDQKENIENRIQIFLDDNAIKSQEAAKQASN